MWAGIKPFLCKVPLEDAGAVEKSSNQAFQESNTGVLVANDQEPSTHTGVRPCLRKMPLQHDNGIRTLPGAL